MVRLKGFQKLTPIDEAIRVFFDAAQVKKAKATDVPLCSAFRRVLVESVVAEEDLPRFDRSAVDGYAVRAEDTVGVSQFKSRAFRIIEEGKVDDGHVKQVWTGNPIPEDANAVVMLENAKRTENKVEVWVRVTPGENVSKKGEDVQKGEVAIRTGTRLQPQHLGLIAALGKTEVKVAEKPRIAILATGNELVELGCKPLKSQVFDVNRLVLSALCCELGAEPLDLGIAGDDVDEISGKVESGLEKADMIITSGGTSVGSADLVPEAVNKIGKPGIVVHGVAMRPAMPTALAVVKEKPIIILPGNPVAAIVGFEVFARPLISKMLGLEHVEPRVTIQAKVTRRMATTLGRSNFVRVNVFRRNGELFAEPISARGSSMISTMTRANGYVVVSEDREGLEEGEMVSVQIFDSIGVVDDGDF